MNDKYFIVINDFEDKDDLKYYLGSNEDFKGFWFRFAKQLGFYDNPVSIASPYGREVKPLVQNGNLLLQREKYNNYLKVTISNLRFFLDSESFAFGEITQQNLETKELLLANYMNYTEIPMNVKKSIILVKSTTTTASSSHKIATSVELTASTEVNVPFYADKRDVSYTFGYEYNMANQKEYVNLSKTWDEVSLTIPPQNKIPLKLIVYSSLTNVAFTALAQVDYSVSFKGYISVDDNTYRDQKAINPRGRKHVYTPFMYTFGNDKTSALDDINTQIANRNTPGSTTPWDWDKFLAKSQVKRYISPNLRKKIGAKFNGQFNQVDSTNVVVEINPSVSL